MKESKMSLTEATQLALLGKLELNEDKPLRTNRLNNNRLKTRNLIKKENVNVNVEDTTGTVSVDTDDTTVIVTTPEATTEPDVIAPIDAPETIEAPAQSDVLPEEPIETEVTSEEDTPSVDEIVNDDVELDVKDPDETELTEEVKEEESVKIEEKREYNAVEDILGWISDHIDEDDVPGLLKDMGITQKEYDECSIPEDKQEHVKEVGLDWISYHIDEADIPALKREFGIKLDESKKLKTESEEDDIPEEIEDTEVSEETIPEETSEEIETDTPEEVETLHFDVTDKASALEAIRQCVAFLSDDKEEVIEPEVSEEIDVPEETETEIDEIEESKKIENIRPKFNKDTFQKELESFLKARYKSVESFKLDKAYKSDKQVKVEGVITRLNGTTKPVSYIFNKVLEGKQFTKYNLLTENKNTTPVTMMTVTNKDKVLECKYIVNKKNLIKD